MIKLSKKDSTKKQTIINVLLLSNAHRSQQHLCIILPPCPSTLLTTHSPACALYKAHRIQGEKTGYSPDTQTGVIFTVGVVDGNLIAQCFLT